MTFKPRYSHEEVERMISEGDLSLTEVYRLRHQHPLNRLTHIVGIPAIGASVVYPVYVWFSSGVLAWKECLILGFIGWGLQFLGHAIEGNRPAFFKDPRHFLIGPQYFFVKPFNWAWRKLKGDPQ